jgi:hypothetical protein
MARKKKTSEGHPVKKILFTVFLLLAVVSTASALGVVETMRCKKVVLREALNATVLVDRFTGEVKYALRHNGEWEPVQGMRKDKLQAIYNTQARPKKKDRNPRRRRGSEAEQ